MTNPTQIRLMRAYNERYSVRLPEVARRYPEINYSKQVLFAKKMTLLDEVLSMQAEGQKLPGMFKDMEELITSEQIEISGMRSLTYDSFRKMLSRAKNEGIEKFVKPARIGNQNAAKYKEDRELIAWLYHLRFDTRNLSNEHIKRIMRHNCLMNNKTMPSDGWINGKLADRHLESLAQLKRYDRGNRHQQRYSSVLHGLRTPLANDRWEVDGTRINTLGWQEDGKAVFLYVIWVVDNHSGNVIGWQFTTTKSPENRWAYMAALKMAVNNTGSLPKNMAMDRFPGHNTEEWQAFAQKAALKGCRIEYTERAEGKQHLERFIGTFQTVFLSQSDYYYGQGVKASGKAAHRPVAYLKGAAKTQKKLGLGYEQMAAECERFIYQYNSTKLTEYGRKNYMRMPYSPAELYKKSDKYNEVKLAPYEIADLFWLEKVLSLTNRALKHTVMHEPCVYQIENYDLLKRLESSRKAMVKYDESDLSQIYVFDLKTNEFLGLVNRQEMAVTRGDFANGKVIGNYKATQKKIEEKQLEEIGEVMEALDESKLVGYWGKEATHRAEEMQLVEILDFAPVSADRGNGKVKKAKGDIYDLEWED